MDHNEQLLDDKNVVDLEETTNENTPLTRDGRQNLREKTRLSSILKSASRRSRDNDSNTVPFETKPTNLFAAYSQYVAKYAISERRRRRTHQSKIGRAAMLIRDCMLGEDRVENPTQGAYDPYSAPNETHWEMTRNTVSMICQKYSMNPWILRLLHSALTILIALTFFEPPHWCRKPMQKHDIRFGNCEYMLNAKGPPASQNNGQNERIVVDFYYPSTNAMWFTIPEANAIEAVCLTIIGTIVLMRIGRDGMSISRFLRKSPVLHNRILQLTCLTWMTLGLIIDVTTTSNIPATRLHPFLRLIMLASFLGGSQREIKVLVGMLPNVLHVLILMFTFMIFYTFFGVVMFVDTEEGRQLFPNFVEGFWSLWIAVTTANYPDVEMPGYNENRWVALYFVSFMTISYFFLMNVILASIVNEYDTAKRQYRSDHADQVALNLKKAYNILTEGDSKHDDKTSHSRESNRIDRNTVMQLFDVLNEYFPEIRRLSDDETKLLFAILDKDGSSTISEEEFMDFGSVMLIEFVKSSVYATFVEVKFPEFYESAGWQRFCRIVKSVYFEYTIDLVLVLNAVVVSVQSYPELSGDEVHLDPKYWDGNIDTVWELMEAIFTVIYALEALSKIAVLGWREYWEHLRNKFDFLITCLAILSTAIVYYPNQYSDSRLIRMVVTARVLRLIRLLTALKPFQMIGRITAGILPQATGVILVLFLLMYFFAALGVELYGGLITRDPDDPKSYLLLGTIFADSAYWANNFNDMLSGMNVLFNLLVVNNWFVIEDGFEATTEGRWVRLYFLSFHILGVILVNNLVIAFIINNFLEQLAMHQERADEEIVVEGSDAVIRDRRAILLDASQITGTKTSLSGKYIARLGHAHSDTVDDKHHHDRLRAMFTQSGSSSKMESELSTRSNG